MRMGAREMTLVVTCLVVSCWAEWFYIYDCVYNMSYGECNNGSKNVYVHYDLSHPSGHLYCEQRLLKEAKCSAKRVEQCRYTLEGSACVSSSTEYRYTPKGRQGACSHSFKLKLPCVVDEVVQMQAEKRAPRHRDFTK